MLDSTGCVIHLGLWGGAAGKPRGNKAGTQPQVCISLFQLVLRLLGRSFPPTGISLPRHLFCRGMVLVTLTFLARHTACPALNLPQYVCCLKLPDGVRLFLEARARTADQTATLGLDSLDGANTG